MTKPVKDQKASVTRENLKLRIDDVALRIGMFLIKFSSDGTVIMGATIKKAEKS